jgi:hypothetical protein
MVIIRVWCLSWYRLGECTEGWKSDLRCVSFYAGEKIQIYTHRIAWSTEFFHGCLDHRRFGGGFGLGTPVVSYAPRPMLQGVASLVIMWDAEEMSMSGWV